MLVKTIFVILAIQIVIPAEGELLEKTVQSLTNIKPAWEACNVVGDDSIILDGIDKMLEAELQAISLSMEDTITKEHWEKLLESDADKELELVSEYGIEDKLKQGLESTFSHLEEYCKANQGAETSEIIPWDDTEAFGRDMIGTLFHVWRNDDGEEGEYTEL